MRDPFTSLPAPMTLDASQAPPIPGQQALDLNAAGYRPPPALSPSYPYVPLPRYVLTPRDARLSGLAGANTDTLRAQVRELSGRDVMGYPSVRERLRRTGRIYVACAGNAPARDAFGGGFLVIDTHHASQR